MTKPGAIAAVAGGAAIGVLLGVAVFYLELCLCDGNQEISF